MKFAKAISRVFFPRHADQTPLPRACLPPLFPLPSSVSGVPCGLGLGLLFACWLMPLLALAQPTAKTMPPTAKTTPAAPVGAGNTLQRLLETGKGSLIVLSSQDLGKQDVPESVLVPFAEYERLTKELARLAVPRREASLTSIDIKGLLGETKARLHVTLGVRVDRGDGDTIDLRMQQAQCSRAHCLQPRPSREDFVPLYRVDQDSPFQLKVENPGSYTYELELDVDVVRAGDDYHLQLSLPHAPIKSLHLTSAEPLEEARAGISKLPYTLAADRKVLRTSLRSDEGIDIFWRPRHERPSIGILEVSGDQHVRLQPQRLETRAELKLQARQETREWVLRLPKGEQLESVLVKVAGEPVKLESREILAGKENDRDRLRLRFASPIQGRAEMTLLTARPRPDNSAALVIEGIQCENADFHTGFLLLYAPPHEIVVTQWERGLRRVPLAQLEPGLRKDQPRLAYQCLAQPVGVSLRVEQARSSLSVSSTSRLTIQRERAELQTDFALRIRHARTRSLVLRLGREWKDLDISSAEAVSTTELGESEKDGFRQLQVTLADESMVGDLIFTLRAQLPVVPDQSLRIRLPYPRDLPNSPGRVEVFRGPHVAVEWDGEGSRFLQAQVNSGLGQGLATAAPSKAAAASDGTQRPWLTFRHQLGAPELSLRILRLPPPETEVVAEMDLGHNSAQVRANLRWRSQQGLFQQVVIHVPEGCGDVKIRGKTLATEVRPKTGQTELSLTTPQEDCTLEVEYRVDVKDNASGSWRLPLVLPIRSARVACVVTLWSDRGRQIRASAPWSSESPRDVKPRPRWHPLLRVHALEPENYLELRLEPLRDLATQLIARCAVEEFWAPDGRRRGRVRLVIQDYRDPLLTLHVPRGLRFEAWLDGKPAQTQAVGDEWRTLELPLPAKPRSLELRYEGRLPDSAWGATLAWHDWTVPMPGADAVVTETRWAARIPKDRWVWCRGNGWSLLDWRFTGWLRAPRVPTATPSASDWLRHGASETQWADDQWATFFESRFHSATGMVIAVENPPLGATEPWGRLWMFGGWGNSHNLRIVVFDATIWVLLCSGTVFVLGLAIARLKYRLAFAVLAALGVFALALTVLVPDVLPWLLLGGQWGLAWWGVALLARWYSRRGRFGKYAERKTRWRDSLGVSWPALVRSLQPLPVPPREQVQTSNDG